MMCLRYCIQDNIEGTIVDCFSARPHQTSPGKPVTTKMEDRHCKDVKWTTLIDSTTQAGCARLPSSY